MTNDLNALLDDYSRIPEYSGLDVNSVATRSLFGNLPIHVAAFRGIAKELEILIAAGADVNSRGEYGFTPLHNAVEQGHLLAVKFLVKKGADAHLRNDDMQTPEELSDILHEDEITLFLKGV